MFFEETIGSLEEDDERTRMSAGGHRLAVERPASHTQTARHHSPVDHDIIDLVHPTPDPNKHKDTLPIIRPGTRNNTSPPVLLKKQLTNLLRNETVTQCEPQKTLKF